MARFRKPFFRPARGLWYVWHGGKQINLGSEKDAAFAAFHELKSKPESQPVTAAEAAKLVVVIVDQFLDWCEKNRAPDTYRWYKDRINSFCKTIDANTTIDRLNPPRWRWRQGQTWLSTFDGTANRKAE